MSFSGGKECLCSSLAINCFQFGCFLHDSPRRRCSHDNRDWMTKLSSVSPEKKLRDLVIPGTHDSASNTIPKYAPFSAVALCQNVSVFEQLRRGARYLDLRIRAKKDSTSVDDIFICHGIMKGGRFPDVVDEVHRFLDGNPGEFVIVEVAHEPNKHEMGTLLLLRALQLLSSAFDGRITLEDARSWFRVGEVTLGELREKEKNALLLVNDRMYDFSHDGTRYDLDAVAGAFGCHENRHFMRNRWHNTAHARTLLQRNEVFLEEANGDRGLLTNSQFVMTPQPPGGLSDVVGLLLGAKSLRPVSLAREMYCRDVLETFIRENAESAWNIVLLDFVDLCPQLVRFLLGLNSSKYLRVMHASVESKSGITTDVTEAVRKLRKRSCCVYVLDFKKDLYLSVNEGTLKLKVQFDEEEIMDIVVPFDRHTEYLLCDVPDNR